MIQQSPDYTELEGEDFEDDAFSDKENHLQQQDDADGQLQEGDQVMADEEVQQQPQFLVVNNKPQQQLEQSINNNINNGNQIDKFDDDNIDDAKQQLKQKQYLKQTTKPFQNDNIQTKQDVVNYDVTMQEQEGQTKIKDEDQNTFHFDEKSLRNVIDKSTHERDCEKSTITQQKKQKKQSKKVTINAHDNSIVQDAPMQDGDHVSRKENQDMDSCHNMGSSCNNDDESQSSDDCGASPSDQDDDQGSFSPAFQPPPSPPKPATTSVSAVSAVGPSSRGMSRRRRGGGGKSNAKPHVSSKTAGSDNSNSVKDIVQQKGASAASSRGVKRGVRRGARNSNKRRKNTVDNGNFQPQVIGSHSSKGPAANQQRNNNTHNKIVESSGEENDQEEQMPSLLEQRRRQQPPNNNNTTTKFESVKFSQDQHSSSDNDGDGCSQKSKDEGVAVVPAAAGDDNSQNDQRLSSPTEDDTENLGAGGVNQQQRRQTRSSNNSGFVDFTNTRQVRTSGPATGAPTLRPQQLGRATSVNNGCTSGCQKEITPVNNMKPQTISLTQRDKNRVLLLEDTIQSSVQEGHVLNSDLLQLVSEHIGLCHPEALVLDHTSMAGDEPKKRGPKSKKQKVQELVRNNIKQPPLRHIQCNISFTIPNEYAQALNSLSGNASCSSRRSSTSKSFQQMPAQEREIDSLVQDCKTRNMRRKVKELTTNAAPTSSKQKHKKQQDEMIAGNCNTLLEHQQAPPMTASNRSPNGTIGAADLASSSCLSSTCSRSHHLLHAQQQATHHQQHQQQPQSCLLNLSFDLAVVKLLKLSEKQSTTLGNNSSNSAVVGGGNSDIAMGATAQPLCEEVGGEGNGGLVSNVRIITASFSTKQQQQ